MLKDSLHVVKRSEGGWAVKKGASPKASKIYDTKNGAISHGRKIARVRKVELYIHGKDGKIIEKDNYSVDNGSSKDKTRKYK